MTRRAFHLVTLLVIAGTIGATAKGVDVQTDIAGRWDVESATSIRRNADGTVEVLATSRFRLDITVDKDTVSAVSAVWALADGTGEPPLSLSGTWRDGRLDLATDWFETEASNRGERVALKARWVMRGSLTDGRLGGTRHLEIQGRTRDAAPISWTGRRAPGPAR